jgi:hypothetical protein
MGREWPKMLFLASFYVIWLLSWIVIYNMYLTALRRGEVNIANVKALIGPYFIRNCEMGIPKMFNECILGYYTMIISAAVALGCVALILFVIGLPWFR